MTPNELRDALAACERLRRYYNDGESLRSIYGDAPDDFGYEYVRGWFSDKLAADCESAAVLTIYWTEPTLLTLDVLRKEFDRDPVHRPDILPDVYWYASRKVGVRFSDRFCCAQVIRGPEYTDGITTLGELRRVLSVVTKDGK